MSQTFISLSELDEKGWAQVHYAAFGGFVLSVEKFVEEDIELLEVETDDGQHMTPFLLAMKHGGIDIVKCLVGLNAKLDAIGGYNTGAIEIAMQNQNIPILQYLIDLNNEKLPVLKKLFYYVLSDNEEEARQAAECLEQLTRCVGKEIKGVNEHLFTKGGGIALMMKVLKGTTGKAVKVPTMKILINLIHSEGIMEQLVSKGRIGLFIKLLRSSNNFIVQYSAEILKELASLKAYADQEIDFGVLPSYVNIIQQNEDSSILAMVVYALGSIAESSEENQKNVLQTPELVPGLVSLFQTFSTQESLVMALTCTIKKIVKNNPEAQLAFVNENVTNQLINIVRKIRTREIQLSAVDAVHMLAKDNGSAQKAMLRGNVQQHLMELFKKGRSEKLQEKTASALWALAGHDLVVRKAMAKKMGVQLLTEFVNSMRETLHYIGSEGLGALSSGPIHKRADIFKLNGIPTLVCLLRTSKEETVLSLIQTLRNLCVGVGFITYPQCQKDISQNRGIHYLLNLITSCGNCLVQVESAVTLGYLCLNNPKVLKEVHQHPDFSFTLIFKMLYDSDNDRVRLRAGYTLAVFSFNNIEQQRIIADTGGVVFSYLQPFLNSDDEYYRCCSAFQVVILARVMVDKEQALSSAVGIKILTDLLKYSELDSNIALAADFTACLAHTRSGVPQAMIAVDVVSCLCSLLMSSVENIRGCAAIALSYLAQYHPAERQLLNKCRTNPSLMKTLVYYSNDTKLPYAFLEEWKHYERIGLPPVLKPYSAIHSTMSMGNTSNNYSSPSDLPEQLVNGFGPRLQYEKLSPQSRISSSLNYKSSEYLSLPGISAFAKETTAH